MNYRNSFVLIFLSCTLISPGNAFSQSETKPETMPETSEEAEVTEEIETPSEVVEEEEEIVEEEEGDFDLNEAVSNVTDILYSKEVESRIRACFEKWSAMKDVEFSMVVRIDPQGALKELNVPPGITNPVGKCIVGELADVPFLQSPEGLTVGAHYEFHFKKEQVVVAPGPAVEEARPKEEEYFSDPGKNRLFYHQTAFNVGKKKSNFTFVDIGHLIYSYGVTDNFDFTVSTMVPAMVWGLGLFPKVAGNVHRNVRIGIIPSFGLFIIIPSHEEIAMMYGATPVLTVGNEDRCFNLSVHVQGFSWINIPGDHHGFMTIAPEIGASIRVAKKVKLNVELLTPIMVHMWGDSVWVEDFRDLDGVNTLNGKLWFAMVGIRVFGKKFFGDFGLAWAIFPGWWDIQMFMPIGWPVAAFGFQI